ncbi:MAG TPA: hypothetical protein PLS53_09250 [Thermoanaerobaculaceae bacterium]|nr:hypothetical protein [Thermoanaerobaculaceae bacterium]HPS78329.1 hypothetical protein [Thermoanaerobaculaceae bacterium]
MKRFFVILALVTLAAMPVMAEDHAGCMKSKGMQRTVANIDNGVKVTMSCSDPTMVPEIQAKAAKGCAGECPMSAKGVTRTVENTADGAVVTATSADAAQVKALQEHAAKGCGGEPAGKSCCKHGEDAKAGCKHGEAATGKEQGKGHTCPMSKDSSTSKS